MDRTTLTAALKPLERRGLIKVIVDPGDRRTRLLKLTAKGRTRLSRSVPIWEKAHSAIDKQLPKGDPESLRGNLQALSALPAFTAVRMWLREHSVSQTPCALSAVAGST